MLKLLFKDVLREHAIAALKLGNNIFDVMEKLVVWKESVFIAEVSKLKGS
jgi:hypothetical protein